ncbi:MAG: hypothetical protein AAF486_07845 [Pseudomonadota bacterium]
MTALEISAPPAQRRAWVSRKVAVRLAWALWFLAYALLSAVWPRDADFDVMHYHVHNGWSAMQGRLHQDLAPAEMHSFLNPTYNIALWWLIERLPGPGVAFLIGLVQAALLPVLYGLSRQVARATGFALPAWGAVVIAVAGLTCAPAWTFFASLRNDHLGAMAFLAGLYFILRAQSARPGAMRGWAGAALAAGLVGAAAGLKLTNMIYVPAFAVFALAMAPDWTLRIKWAIAAALAGAAALAVCAGPWMWTMWQAFGNPVFPKFASAFPGPDAPIDVSRDTRYLPANLLEAITLPIHATFEGRHITEGRMMDLRLLLGYGASLILAALAMTRRNLPRAAIALASSYLVLFAVWVALFAIMRYAAAAWMLAPLLAWVTYRAAGGPGPTGWKGAGLALCGAAVLVLSTSPERVRRAPWISPVEPYAWAQSPAGLDTDGALIFLAARFPSAFTAPAFPNARLTHIDAQEWSAPFLAPYRRRIEAAVAAHDGPMFVLHCAPEMLDPEDPTRLEVAYTAELALERDGPAYGLSLVPGSCREVPTSFSTPLTIWQICEVTGP